LLTSCCFTITTEVIWESRIWLFILCHMSSHLQAGAGCSGTPYKNIKTLDSYKNRYLASSSPEREIEVRIPFQGFPVMLGMYEYLSYDASMVSSST
jgi:hypothetical protein